MNDEISIEDQVFAPRTQSQSLPKHRRMSEMGVFHSPWDASVEGPGAAIVDPHGYCRKIGPMKESRRSDVVFGIAMAIVIALAAWVLIAYGSVPA